MNRDLKCGFCKYGIEVESICGKLWHDEVHKCTSHQRCMQYSALLCQYKMKKFGGFKVKEVLREQNRGNKLKCSICMKVGKNSKNKLGGSASAGCAIQKCKKTFHFYCARTDSKARTRRIVLGEGGGRQESIVLYRVFCSKEHEELFLEPNMKLTEDSDTEEFCASSSNGRDVGRPEKENDSDAEMTALKRRRESDAEADDCAPTKKSCSDGLRPIEDFVVCFMENLRNVNPTKFEVLVNHARELFDVDASNIFMWKYNTDNFSCQHMLHLLVDISQALCDDDEVQVERLVCLLGDGDIARFDGRISSSIDAPNGDCGASAAAKTEEHVQSLRKQIVDRFEEVNKKFGSTVAKYCVVESLESTRIAYVVLCDATDPLGGMRRRMKKSHAPDRFGGGGDEEEEEEEGGGGTVESCEKTLSVHAHDLEAVLFCDVQSSAERFGRKGRSAEEESRAMLEWLTNATQSFCGPVVFPSEELLCRRDSSSGGEPETAIDKLHSLLKFSTRSAEGSYPYAVVVKPLDVNVVAVAGYLSKCISKVVEDRLTVSHDVYMFVGIDRQCGIKRIRDFLPSDVSRGQDCKVKMQAFTVRSDECCDDVNVILHFWIDI